MDFEEILVAIAWGPLLGALSAQFISAVICVVIWLRYYKKINRWPMAEYLIMSTGPVIKIVAIIIGISFGHYIVSEPLNCGRVYEYFFTQTLILVGLFLGSLFGVLGVRNYARLFS